MSEQISSEKWPDTAAFVEFLLEKLNKQFKNAVFLWIGGDLLEAIAD